MDVIQRGHRAGRALITGDDLDAVACGATSTTADRDTITQQVAYARRLQADQAFRDAVRLMSRADSELQGKETALEHVVRCGDVMSRAHEHEIAIVNKNLERRGVRQ